MENEFKVGDRLLWTSNLDKTQPTATASFLRYENNGKTVVCNNWSDIPDLPEKEDRCQRENFRLLTPLELCLT